jgi:hypothetical protein
VSEQIVKRLVNIAFAFPSNITFTDGSSFDSPGMPLRDYFAAACISKLITNGRDRQPVLTPEQYAVQAYEFADAMMKARGSYVD